MRIYTEVNFEWDDKQNQLVETSSKSFDYQGPIAECSAWETKYFFDVAGNKYKREIEYNKNPKRAVYSRTTNMTTGELIAEKHKDHLGMGEHRDYNNVRIKRASDNGEMYGTTEDGVPSQNTDWAEAYKGTYGLTPSNNRELDLKWANEVGDMDASDRAAAVTKAQGFGDTPTEDYWAPTETEIEAGGLTDEGFLVNNQEDKWSQDWYDYEKVNNPNWDTLKDTLELSDIPGQEWQFKAEDVPLGTAAELTKSTIETAMKDWADIIDPNRPDPFQDELEEAIKQLGWAEEDIITAFGEFEEKVGEEGTIPGAFETGIEETVTGREEKLEALRGEAKGEIRAAEAKIGAAGFASTGVGRTAREMLAEEIGGEARDIDVEFTEERESVETARTEAARVAPGSWESATTAYERLLETYGAVQGEGETAYSLAGVIGGKATEAEAHLTGIQADLESMIQTTRTMLIAEDAPGAEDWDPFSDRETALYGLGEKYGWNPISGTFSTDVTKGAFAETIAAKTYEPSEALQLYDPETYTHGKNQKKMNHLAVVVLLIFQGEYIKKGN